MRIRKALSTVVLGAAVTGWLVMLTGCFRTTHVVQRTQAPDMYRSTSVEHLEEIISDRDAAIKTLTASVLLTASTGGGKEGKVVTYTSFKGYIFVRKPADLRVIMQLPVIGSRALDMVSNGETFTLVHATGGSRRCMDSGQEHGHESVEKRARKFAAAGVFRFAAGSGRNA